MQRHSPASSSSAVPPPADPFPWNTEGVLVRFSCRTVLYTAHIVLVEREAGGSIVSLETTDAAPKRPFSTGEEIILYMPDGRRWSGYCQTTLGPAGHQELPGLCGFVFVRVPDDARGNPNLLQSEPTHLDFQTFAKDVLIKVHPVIKRKKPCPPRCPNNPWKMCKVSQEEVTKDPEQADLSDKIKIAINGFGKIGRLLAEVALQSVDVELVAINDHSITSSSMVRVWKNSNIDVTIKDYQTLLFKKMYYKIFGEGEKPRDLLDQKVITVFHVREHNKIPWDETGAEFVVESAGVFTDDKDTSHFKVNCCRHNPGTGIVPDSRSVMNCLIRLPKVICAFGLIFDHPVKRTHLNAENEETSSRIASLNIVTGSISAAEAVRKVFPEWDGDPISKLFEADAASCSNHMSDVYLTVTLERSVECRDTEDATASNRLCGAEAGVHLAAILSFCVDMIRCVPVGGCRLELL